MQFTTCFTSVCLLLFCSLWSSESRHHHGVLTVHNGLQWGEWGERQYCPKGFATGFQLKVQPYRGILDDTSVNALALRCPDGTMIKSSVGPDGDWNKELSCPEGQYLVQFGLEVTPHQPSSDDTAVDNVRFICSDKTILEQEVMPYSADIDWSDPCPSGGICGIRSRVQKPENYPWSDNTGLNDVVLYCCKKQ